MTIFDPNHTDSLKYGVFCSPQEQKRIIKELNDEAESNLREGNLYYLISTKWFIGWQRYTGNDDYCEMNGSSPDFSNGVDRPGPIDNSDLISNINEGDLDGVQLIRTLEEGQDYMLVPEPVWEKLLEWYTGGPPLARKLISQGAFNKKFNVEVYPLSLKLIDSSDNSQSEIQLSKKASIRELYEKVSALKGIPQTKVHIWDYFNEQKVCLLVPSDMHLEDTHLQMDQPILLELETAEMVSSGLGVSSPRKELALVPTEPSRSSVTIAGGPTFSCGYSTKFSINLFPGLSLSSSVQNGGHDSTGSLRKKEKGGLAGLQNLGNTCFMNSALQCLVHTAPLVEYFLRDYSDEINKQNPLGMHGELAIAFGDLLREMWSSGRSTVAPRVFKGKLAQFAPQFSGYNQHDSQALDSYFEFHHLGFVSTRLAFLVPDIFAGQFHFKELLAFLLDGLHEDLNRVKKKPYIEMKDSDGRPDEEYAEECWKYHKARNDSVIVDICQGQYKSTLVCPVCNKISITFDPFMYLSLPLPSTVNRTMTITVLCGIGSGLPMPYTVTISKHGSCRDLIQALETACCLRDDESLLLVEVYNHKIYKYFENGLDHLSSIKDDDRIVAYRVPKKQPGLKRLEIVHQSPQKKLIGSPLVTYLQGEPQTVADLCFSITRILFPLRKTHVSLSRNHSKKENGCASGVNGEADNELMDNTSVCNSGCDFPFQLSVTASGSKKIDDDYVKTSPNLKVTLDWTDRAHELYDISYLEELLEVYKSLFSAKKTRQEAVSLFTCLDAFLKEEPLGLDDMWYCPTCKEHRQASKKLDLWRLPEILVIHLKRFSYSRYLKNKLDTFVSFPLQNLDLGNYANNKDASNVPYIYELYAISNHYGGIGGGHYSVYAKLIDEDRWYHFDDSHVSPVNESEIKTTAAYVLFYRRVKTQAKYEVGGSSCDNNHS